MLARTIIAGNLILICLLYLLQITRRYWRAPNPYRFAWYLSSTLFIAGVLLVLGIPLLGQVLPTLLSPSARLITHQLFNACLMVAAYAAACYGENILNGYHSPRARRHRWMLGLLVLLALGLMSVFFLRGLVRGEREAETWLPYHPAENPDLIVVSLICIAFMIFMLVRIVGFCQTYARITPLPSFKAGNTLMMIAAGLDIGSYLASGIGLAVPAMSPGAPALIDLVYLILCMSLLCFFLGARLVDHPTRRFQRLGDWLWAQRTVWRVQVLWRDLTSTIPEVIPPLQLPWLTALLQNELAALRDARIIEILDALRRLNVHLWDEDHHPVWLTGYVQVVDEEPLVSSPREQAEKIERLALGDACTIVLALRAFTPRAPQPQPDGSPTTAATLTHPPGLSLQEIHYLELVARAYRRIRHSVVLQALHPLTTDVRVVTE